jgi:amino acid transporter
MAQEASVDRTELFARKASGLVREFGFFDAYVFNTMGYAIGVGGATVPFLIAAATPGANLYAVLTLGALLALFNGFTYGLLSGVMPRSGGDYVYNSRALHPAIGFAANWGFTWSQFLGIGIYSQWCVNYALSGTLAGLGYNLGSSGLVNLSAQIAAPWPTFIIATLILALVIVFQLAGTRFLRRFFNLFFVIGMIGTVLMIIVLLTSSRGDFVAEFNSFMEAEVGISDGYNAVIQAARDAGWRESTPSVLAVILALPIGYWAYVGFTYSAYIGGEVKEPQRTQSLAIVGSLVSGWVLYMLLDGGYFSTVGRTFHEAVSYLDYYGESPIPVSAVVNFFSGVLTKNALVNIIGGASFFIWYFLLLFCMFTVCVRNIFAWAFDQVVPTWLTKVTPRTRAPWSATLAVGVLAWILLAVSIFTPLFNYIFNYAAMFSIGFWITSFSAILLPYRKPDLFNAAPPSVRRMIGGVPLMTIAGVVNLLLFSLILYASFTMPTFAGPIGLGATAFVIGLYVVGFVVYFIAREIRLREGVDLNLLYTEIPPE